jgi:hypothetical protein
VPALVFLPLAYWFDHRGVLAMGVTTLASWVGLTVAPLTVLSNNDFWNDDIRGVAIGVGLTLVATGFHAEYRGRKAHFAFTYLLLGSNLALIALAVSLVHAAFDERSVASADFALLMLGLCTGLFWYARRSQSYWFLVLAAGYAYFAFACLLIQVSMGLPGDFIVFELVVVLPSSALSVVLFFVNLKTILSGTPTQRPPSIL